MYQWLGWAICSPRPYEPRLSMRTAVVLLLLPLSACAGAYATSSDGRLKTRIDTAYAARDACLAKNVASDSAAGADAMAVARAVAQSCVAQTEKLVEVSNRDGDPRVADLIRQDSEFRAMGYVLRARGQVTN
jgi:hypothetical protein